MVPETAPGCNPGCRGLWRMVTFSRITPQVSAPAVHVGIGTVGVDGPGSHREHLRRVQRGRLRAPPPCLLLPQAPRPMPLLLQRRSRTRRPRPLPGNRGDACQGQPSCSDLGISGGRVPAVSRAHVGRSDDRAPAGGDLPSWVSGKPRRHTRQPHGTDERVSALHGPRRGLSVPESGAYAAWDGCWA